MAQDAGERDVFDVETGKASFEDFCLVNGGVYWYASDLAAFLGYEHLAGVMKAVNKAMAACATLGIAILDNFKEETREVNGETIRDYKLTRFACLLAAMNGDVRRPQVAKAQAYFITLAESFRRFLEDGENVERVVIREQITDHEKSLSGVAKAAGVVQPGQYALFQNAGYLGMYNMNLGRLREVKGVPANRSPLDFMGREELAANLFRITQTEAKIRNEGLKGQRALENAAQAVGQKVRHTMIDTGGTAPEHLPPVDDIRKVRSGLKGTQRAFVRLDKSKKALPPPAPRGE